MSKVFVLDTHKQPLDPVHAGRARILLNEGKAAVFKRYPFTIILKASIEQPQVHPLRIKIDPGSQTTGIALVDDASGEVVFAAELVHRGEAIKHALDQRRERDRASDRRDAFVGPGAIRPRGRRQRERDRGRRLGLRSIRLGGSARLDGPVRYWIGVWGGISGGAGGFGADIGTSGAMGSCTVPRPPARLRAVARSAMAPDR